MTLHSRRWWGRPALCSLAIGALAACGDGRQDDGGEVSSLSLSTTLTSATMPATDSATGDDTMSSDSIGKLDVAGMNDSGDSTGVDACQSLDQVSGIGLQPADIIVVVDNSGSMDAEAGFVQANMNAFSSAIFLANIDAHVVLISADNSSDAGICMAQPLGSGACPDDNNLPGYMHIIDGVGSNDALQKIIQHHATWAPQMRATANKHIIVITDDDSDLSAGDFNQQFLALDPTYAGYKAHAIASPEDPVVACLAQTTCCPFIPLSAALSQEYIDLAALTGGIFGNLCEQEFGPIFTAVAEQVIQGSSLACEYAIPPAPKGETFDPGEVNVGFFDSADVSLLELGYVDGAAACAGVGNGWYYDDPVAPTTILLCPQTCDQVQGFPPMSRVSIQFGCATVPAG